jgi:hypothetical protein
MNLMAPSIITAWHFPSWLMARISGMVVPAAAAIWSGPMAAPPSTVRRMLA